jgi:hypothetical protein
MQKPVKYLVLIEAAGAPTARLFDAEQAHILDIDATSEEVADMTSGHTPAHDGAESRWDKPLQGHTSQERRAAQIFTLDI